jgi:opacity protein-like surface antigen
MPRRNLLAVFVAVIAVPAFAAPQLKPRANKIEPLAGTSWSGQTAEGWPMTIDFAADGTMTVAYNMTKFNKATWKQDGDKIYWEMNGCYCEFNGKLVGDTLNGDSHNVAGKKWQTNMTRLGRDR